jgi:tetratricopeptide (TPR) repeat protein
MALVAQAEEPKAPKEYKPYGRHDLRDALTTKKTEDGKDRYLVDTKVIDKVVRDLAAHAKDYPPTFRSDEEKSRAVRDAAALVKVFDVLTAKKDADPELLLSAAFVDGIAHNLDVKGAAQKAIENYERVLKAEPDNAKANLQYGIFLAGTGSRQKDCIAYLEKALKLGVDDARYTLGLVHLTLGDKDKAIEYLEAYSKTQPKDERPQQIIEAIKSGRVKIDRGE